MFPFERGQRDTTAPRGTSAIILSGTPANRPMFHFNKSYIHGAEARDLYTCVVNLENNGATTTNPRPVLPDG